VWGSKPYLYACLGAWNIGLREEAFKHAEVALKLDPTNQLLRNNVDIMLSIMIKERL
jgi:hypothetical protein